MRAGDYVICTRTGNNANGDPFIEGRQRPSFNFGHRNRLYRVYQVDIEDVDHDDDDNTLYMTSLDGTCMGRGRADRFRLATNAELVEHRVIRPEPAIRAQPAPRLQGEQYTIYTIVYRNNQGALSQVTYSDQEAAQRRARLLIEEGKTIVARKKFTFNVN